MLEKISSFSGKLGNQVFDNLQVKKYENRLINGIKRVAELIAKIFLSSLAVLEALFFSIFCVVAIPLYPIFPERYAYLSAHVQAALQAIVDNADGKVQEKSWFCSLQDMKLAISHLGSNDKIQGFALGIASNMLIGYLAYTYLRLSQANSFPIDDNLRSSQTGNFYMDGNNFDKGPPLLPKLGHIYSEDQKHATYWVGDLKNFVVRNLNKVPDKLAANGFMYLVIAVFKKGKNLLGRA